MKTKLKTILLAAQIKLCWLFIWAWQRIAKDYFENGGHFYSKRSKELYKHLQHHCDRVTLLTYKYRKLTSMGTFPMEQSMQIATAK